MNDASTPIPLPAPTQSHGSVLRFDPTAERDDRPSLRCPIAPAINPHVNAAHHHSLRWAVEAALVEAGGSALARLDAARFSWLAARSYPTVGAEQLALVSDWLTFLFFYDDQCDTPRAVDPRVLDTLMATEDRLIEIGHGAAPHAGDPPLVLALADIRRRATSGAIEPWLERLGRHIEAYIEGCRWERLLRIEGRVPSLATYARLRPLVSAVSPCFDFAGMYIEAGNSSPADDVLVQQLEIMANNHICWVNDVYGLDKELAERTTSNLVVVLAHQLGLDWDAALDRAIEMCNDELDAFLELRRRMPTRSDRSRGYIHALEAWMRGNLDWYGETRRYAPDPPSRERPDLPLHEGAEPSPRGAGHASSPGMASPGGGRARQPGGGRARRPVGGRARQPGGGQA